MDWKWDVFVQRSVHFERWWEAHKFGRLTSIAVCSMIISIIILISRPMSLSGPDLSDNLQSSTHGVVFPLYHYTYFPNDSAEMGGREMWYGGRGAIRREIREESNLLLNILGGYSSNHIDMYLSHLYSCSPFFLCLVYLILVSWVIGFVTSKVKLYAVML